MPPFLGRQNKKNIQDKHKNEDQLDNKSLWTTCKLRPCLFAS